MEEEIAAEPDPAGWVLAVPRAITSLRRRRLAPTQLWLHALSEATDDEEIRRHFRRHLREVHDYVAGVLRRAQAAGAIDPDRDVEAEAWIGIGVGLLRSVQDRFGGLLGEEEIDAIASSRVRWLTGGIKPLRCAKPPAAATGGSLINSPLTLRPSLKADPAARPAPPNVARFVARASQMRLRMRGETTLTDMSKTVK